jgi:hypothetical protein
MSALKIEYTIDKSDYIEATRIGLHGSAIAKIGVDASQAALRFRTRFLWPMPVVMFALLLGGQARNPWMFLYGAAIGIFVSYM